MRAQQSPLALVPLVHTERLRLRGHVMSDLDAVAAMWAEPEVTRHITGRPQTREESWSRLLRYVGHWALMGYGYWLIEERETGRFVGDGGFAAAQRGIESMADAPEHGWALASWAHGKGYATEATRAMLGWADANLDADFVTCMVSPENTASVRVAERAGYSEMGRDTYKDEPTILYRRDLQRYG